MTPKTGIVRHALTRRDFARKLSAAGLGLAIMPVTRAMAQDGGKPVSLTWSGYDVPEFMPGYVAKYGSMPDLSLISTPNETLSKLQSGFQADIAHPYSSNIASWQRAGVLQPIDTSRLTHWADLTPGFTKVKDAVAADGAQMFVPVDWGTVSVAYRSDQVTPAGSAWDLMWDKSLEGRLAMIGDANMAGPIAAMHLGLADPFAPTEAEMAQIIDTLREQSALTRFYWEAGADVEQALISGEVAAAPVWNGSLSLIRKSGAPVAAMGAETGMLGFVAGLVLLKGATHIDAAYDLIDAIISPEAGKYLIETYGFGHSNSKARDLVAPAALTETGLPEDVEQFLANAVILQDFAPGFNFAQSFQEVKSGF